MSEDRNTRGARRYIALDIHKKYCVIGGVDREGRVVLHAVRVEDADLEDCPYLKTTNKKWFGSYNIRPAFYFYFSF